MRLRTIFLPLGCYKSPTVSVGFHFAKIKPENVLIQIWRRKNRTKKKPKKLNSEEIHFYKFNEARSTVSLQIKVEYNQWKTKFTSFYIRNQCNGTKICFQKILKVQEQLMYLKSTFLLISYFEAKIKPNENKTENYRIRIIKTL